MMHLCTCVTDGIGLRVQNGEAVIIDPGDYTLARLCKLECLLRCPQAHGWQSDVCIRKVPQRYVRSTRLKPPIRGFAESTGKLASYRPPARFNERRW